MRVEVESDVARLTMFASQEAQAIAAHAGAGMHPYPARPPN
jgi:hypothetical protein